MIKNTIEIKEQRKDAFVKEIFLLVMLVASLTTALLPFISSSAKKTPGPFFIIGGIAFLIFTSLFAVFIYKDFNPKTAIILSSKGFTDLKNIGDDIEIEWTNVSSVKLLGKGATPFLGISLENTDIIMEKMKRNEAEIMRENIEDGLPAILISQNDVKIPIKQLRDTIVNHVKDSRTLHNDTPKKEKKLNPFTTTAVLRAFGQVPEAEDDSDTIVVNDSKPVNQSDLEKDSFFDTLQTSSNSNETKSNEIISDGNVQTTEVSEFDDMPDEIKELLNRAKSSKISELGKILSEKDVPYSMIRDNITKNENEVAEDVVNEITEETASDNHTAEKTQVATEPANFANTMDLIDEDGEISTHMEMKDFVTYVHHDVSENDEDSTDENSFETNLDSMLKTAFDNTREEIEREEKRVKKSDTESDFDAGFFPDLVMFNDIELDEMPEEFNAKNKYGNNESTDFITNIEDD